MEKDYDYCKDLRDKYQIDELNSCTISYRINGFVNACNLDLNDSVSEKLVSVTLVPYINTKKEDENTKYNINFARGYDEKGKYFILLGKCNDLDLLFVNYFDKDRNKDKINELPYRISIGKVYHESAYLFNVETVKGTMARFDITKSKEGETLSNILTFYSNIKDFTVILKVIKYFVNNPDIVFMTYNEVMKGKKVNFNNKDIGILIKDDEKNRESVKKNIKR